MAVQKKRKPYTIHRTDVVIDKRKIEAILKSKDMDFKELWEILTDEKGYGLDITYKGFMSLIANRVTWKTLYSHAIVDVLNLKNSDIFTVVKVDIDEKIKEKEKWKEKFDPKLRMGNKE